MLINARWHVSPSQTLFKYMDVRSVIMCVVLVFNVPGFKRWGEQAFIYIMIKNFQIMQRVPYTCTHRQSLEHLLIPHFALHRRPDLHSSMQETVSNPGASDMGEGNKKGLCPSLLPRFV